MEKEQYVYIYNQRQADFFYHSGMKIVEIGKGKKGDTFIKFIRDNDTDKIFTDWLSKKNNELLK